MRPWRLYGALGIVYVVWGSTYLAIRYVVQSLPPLLTASARFLLAAAVVAAYVLVRRGPGAFRASRRRYASSAAVGLLLLLGGNGGVTLAEDGDLPSGLAALLVAALPLWIVVLRALLRDRPTRATVVGVAVGFAGVAVLLLPGARPTGVALGPVLLALGGSLAWAVGSILATRSPGPADALVASAAQMTGGAAGLALTGLLRGESLDAPAVHASSVLAFGYLVVFGSLVAFTAFSWLLAHAPVSLVATYAYVNPVVAVLLGALLVGEDLPVLSALGGAVTLLAVALVVAEEGRRRRDLRRTPGQPTERQGRVRSSAT